MATTSYSMNRSSSPITNIAKDHLFSILLLLPIDSILSFAMTCRRFKSLSFSDSLWESVCRRDWGQSSVDALKPFFLETKKQEEISWKNIYHQIHQLDSLYCCRILSNPHTEEILPCPRASHSLNFVSNCLVLFGGGCEGGRHLDDTWVAYIGNDFRKALKWKKIDSGSPSGRFGHSCIVIRDFLVLFGGINDHGVRQNDAWVGQVSLHDSPGVTLSWTLLNVGGGGAISPPPRGAHAACNIDKTRMLIHGGIGLSGHRLGDTWVVEFSEDLRFGVWQEIVTHPCPPSRSGHTLTYIGGNQIILFGGRGAGYEVLNDVWLFDGSEGDWRWIELFFDLENIPHGLTLPRVGHSANLILGRKLLIYGGEDGYRHRKDDFWVLDIGSIPGVKLQVQTLNPKRSVSSKVWRRLRAKGDKPDPRSFHRACVDHSGRYLFIFGGMVNGLLQPAESSGLRFDGGLFLLEIVLQC